MDVLVLKLLFQINNISKINLLTNKSRYTTYRQTQSMSWKLRDWRRSMSGNFTRTSQNLKQIFDTLDQKEEGEGEDKDEAQDDDEVAIEAEAIKLEVQQNRLSIAEQQADNMTASTSSLPSLSSTPPLSSSSPMSPSSTISSSSSSSSAELRGSPSKESQILERRRGGSLLRRAKRALGISFEAGDASIATDRPSIIFNSCSPDEAVGKLIAEGVIGAEPAAVAEFFHSNASLNKFKIGKYLGTMEEFHIKVLHELVQRLDFTTLDFDIALRHLLYCFRLPAEAQQINRIMDAFGSHYFNTCTNSVFVNADAAQIMAFSSIMLTTDAHNPRVIEKMTKSQFVTLTRGMNGDGNFPKDFLEYMFEKVVDEPLIRIDHTTTLFPYATKRGWVFIQKKKLWKRYYALLFEGSIYLQRKPMESKWTKRITNVKLITNELIKIPTSPTQFGVAITGSCVGVSAGVGTEVTYMFADSHRDIQGWINVMS
eukprot:Phypoly_transcript_06630.p1 GENE.Phypoly_transcript_06630~~Phypoly_transcript_06630.p1  ORF type:complete len:483 (+),score=79.78 Phypoly_transcript_06630:30-1478(+)